MDPAASTRPTPEQRLADLAQSDRTEAAYETATECGECERERKETGDQTALCEEHLMAALGM